MIGRLGTSISFDDVAAGARFLGGARAFLRRPFSLEQARATLRSRLERREASFLALVDRAVYRHAASPYRQLLRLAGCESGDLERLVYQEGIEGALHSLYRRGVYLTVDEYKARRPVVRGSATLTVRPEGLRNPSSASHVAVRTSGSRGAGTRVGIDLAFVRDHAVNTHLTLEAHGGTDWLHAHWGVPGGTAIVNLLEFAMGGTPPVRWFSQLDTAAPGVHPRYRWSSRVVRWTSFVTGVPLPSPVYVPLQEPLPIARWMADVVQTGHTPHLWTYASSAVQVCRAALAAGIDLGGARFTAGGEPLTAARLALIRRSGAQVAPRYGATETDIIGYACLAPEAPDDQHLLHDRLALIQPRPDPERTGLPPLALLVTSTLATAPVILLNVSLGDQAVLVQRTCGCPLERLGWATHLHTIRSFEKLTAGGMTFLDTDVIRVLEEVLPARFGGGPTDYQLLEEEAGDGQPRLRLLVHPAIGPLAAEAVAEAFLAAIGDRSEGERVMALHWREGGFLQVERGAPLTTSSGKILHLHQPRPIMRYQS